MITRRGHMTITREGCCGQISEKWFDQNFMCILYVIDAGEEPGN